MKALFFLFVWLCGPGLGQLALGSDFASEYELLRKLPSAELSALITNRGLPDKEGFIGLHQQHGRWYEAGMQRGGCWMLIGAIVAGDESRADAAWKSIETTFAHQVEDGGFLSNPKPDSTHPPTLPERVETAFFYLQELGHAILVLESSPMEGHFHNRIIALKPRMRRACDFIQRGFDGIIVKAGHTANRMLIAAKAFGLCGLILQDEQLQKSSRRLVEAALARRDDEGVFVENGGRDSSYNAVCVLMGQVLAFYVPDPKLEGALIRTMIWQRTRIKPTGEVAVAGNTRTGVGKEVFMGQPKNVNYTEVVLAFTYFGMLHDDAEALVLAKKILAWSNRPKS